MRSLIVILVTIILLSCGFMLYTWMQPARSLRSRGNAASDARSSTPPPERATPGLPISKGEKVFVESFDNRTGNLTRRFRGATWDPQPDGTVNVEQPEAEFFATNGQVLHVRGARGEIVVPSSSSADGGGSKEAMSRAQLPTRGKLHDVSITLTPAGAKRPTLECTVHNLTFDNDTFLLATEEFKDPGGKLIAADRVPVVIRGEEYDFDGFGLVLHWDERDAQLQSLEIAHGNSLVVKNPKALGISKPQAAGERAATTRPVAARERERSVAMVQPAPATAPASVPTTQSDPPTPYRATFAENVRIERGGRQIAQCDAMNIDFLMGADDAPDGDRAAPTTRPSNDPKKPARARSQPDSATTAPDAQPIRITWNGKMSIQAAPEGASSPTGRDTIVEMISNGTTPVIAKSEDGELRCASFRLNTADNSLAVRSSTAIPLVTVKDVSGVSIVTTAFDYSGEHHVATVRGKSHAEFPITQAAPASTTSPTKPTDVARVDWTDTCTLRMSPAAAPARQRGQMAIEHALLRGDVTVDHPQMNLRSRELELAFDPTINADAKPTNAPIKQLIAREAVRGRFVGPNQAATSEQWIDTDMLSVDFGKTLDHRSYPVKAVASGALRAGDGQSEIRAHYLEVAMSPAPATAPTSQPANDALAPVRLDSMFAQQGVRATSVDGQQIECEQLSMKRLVDGPVYTIQGEVSKPARVSDGKQSLIGLNIEFNPGSQHVSVKGAGSMRGVQDVRRAQNASVTTQPIEVAWQNGLEADGKSNLITIKGGVVAKSTLEDGSVAEVLGNTMTIELSDAPATQPARQSDRATTQQSGNPFVLAGAGSADVSAFRDKQFKIAKVDSSPQSSEVRSTLLASDGSLQRRMNLFAPVLQYEPDAKRMSVPVAGRMLYEDLRGNSTSTQPSNTKLNFRGATAFEWKKEFVYDEAAHRAAMSGNVDVVHRGAAATENYRMHAQRVIAELLPGDTSGAKSDEAQLKNLIADGGVTFNSANLQFVADRVEYDPQKQVLIARGTDRAPATLLDQNGISQGTFTELIYDVQTDRLQLTDPRGTIRRTSGRGAGAITGSGSDSDK